MTEPHKDPHAETHFTTSPQPVAQDGSELPDATMATNLPSTVSPSLPGSLPQSSSTGSQRYRPVRFHARGGLGEVHCAEDTELNRTVALKQIRSEHAGHSENRRRFLVEAEITARLEHPGIVPVYGLVEDERGYPRYAMRFIEGESLQEAVMQYHANAAERSPTEQRMAFRRLIDGLLDVCRTMAYAHSRGIIHRDLKPANVMLGKYGETLVVDWGLAKNVRARRRAPPMRRRYRCK